MSIDNIVKKSVYTTLTLKETQHYSKFWISSICQSSLVVLLQFYKQPVKVDCSNLM